MLKYEDPRLFWYFTFQAMTLAKAKLDFFAMKLRIPFAGL